VSTRNFSSTCYCPGCGSAAAPDPAELAGYRLYLCPRCTLRFAPEAFQASLDYDRVYRSAEYDAEQVQVVPTFTATDAAEHPTYRSFFRQVRHRSGATLLDIGCGVGRFGHGAHARGWSVTGIDVSALAVAAGQATAPFPLRACSVEELVEEEQQFDVITAFEVLEHLSDPVGFLSNARRLLKPGGQAFCTVPNWNSKTVQTSARPDWLPPIHLLFFTPVALQTVGEMSGFINVATGLIRSDPLPAGALSRARWLTRRLRLRPREPLGIWLHAWTPA
jgi:cyclopropane fatty-acyl-phospholipid synthase-like methyltransferase